MENFNFQFVALFMIDKTVGKGYGLSAYVAKLEPKSIGKCSPSAKKRPIAYCQVNGKAIALPYRWKPFHRATNRNLTFAT